MEFEIALAQFTTLSVYPKVYIFSKISYLVPESQSHHPRFSQEKTLSSLSQKSTMEMNSAHLSAVSRRALEHKTPAHDASE